MSFLPILTYALSTLQKQHVIAFLLEQFKGSHENIKSIIYQSHVSKVDQNKNSTFSYCCTELSAGRSTKKTNDSFFRRTL